MEKVESRSLQMIKGSFYLCLPGEVVKALGVEKGGLCEIFPVAGLGAIIRKAGGPGGVPIPQEAIYQGMSAAKVAYHELKRQAAILETTTLKRMELAIFGKVLMRAMIRYHRAVVDQVRRMGEAKRKAAQKILSPKKRAKKGR